MFPSEISVCAGVAASDLERMPLERVEAELCAYAALNNAGMCRWLLLVAEFDRRDGAETWGLPTTSGWLSWRTAIDRRTARDHVRVARALRGLPVLTAAFASGALSYAKVRAVTRVATPASEADLVEAATHATCDQLDTIVRELRRAADVSAAAAQAAHEARSLETWTDDEGAHRLRARLAPEQGAIVDTAIEAAAELVRAEYAGASGSAEPPAMPDADQRRADALVLMAESFLATQTVADDDRYLVLLSAQLPDSGSAEPLCAPRIVGGEGIALETLERLHCSQPWAVELRDGLGNPLWMGRKSRHANRAQRRALARRHDGHCGFPGCGTTARLAPHHSKEWAADQGPTDIDMLVPLCRFHHRCVHEGGFAVEAQAHGGFRFLRPDGREIPQTPTTVPAGPVRHHDTVVAAPAPGDHTRFALDLTIDALLPLVG